MQRQRIVDECHDIYEIEAVGPLIILATWPGLLSQALWIHCIDKTAAQATLVMGVLVSHVGGRHCRAYMGVDGKTTYYPMVRPSRHE